MKAKIPQLFSEVSHLTKLELYNLYGINRFRHTKNPKEKRTYLSLGAVWMILILCVCGYVGGLVYGLSKLGLSEIVPAYLVMITALLIFVFDIFKAGNTIFSPKGYDILSSLPLHQSSIVISRFANMYVEDLTLTTLILLPGTVVYGVFMRPGIGFYFTVLIGGIWVPALPLVASTAFGAVIIAISSRMKRKALAETLLAVIFIIVTLLCSMSLIGLEEADITEIFQSLLTTIGAMIGNIYPPAMWFGAAAIHGQMDKLLLFAGASILAITTTILLVSRSFHKIIRRLLSTSAKHDYQMGCLKTRSMLSALYHREAKRYFASSIYVTNTIVGPVMGVLMSLGIFMTGMDSICASIPLPFDIAGLVPYLLATVFTMMTTTSVAISMEGKHLWIVKSLPISVKAWLDSKILLNLSLILPFYLLAEGLLIIAIKPDFLALLWLLVIPAISILFAVVFGITVNLKYPKFDWDKEEHVVKQSASAAIGGLGGALISMLCCIPVIGVQVLLGNQWIAFTKATICFVLLTITGFLYRKNYENDLNTNLK